MTFLGRNLVPSEKEAIRKFTTETMNKPAYEPVKQLSEQIRAKLIEIFPNHKPNDMVVLCSEPGCESQDPHADYTYEDLTRDRNDRFPENEDMPLGVVVALQDNTFFDVWPGSILTIDKPATPIRLKLKRAGDVLIFRGDLVHAGAFFKHYNIRIHTYLDHPSVKRTPNTTNKERENENIIPRDPLIDERGLEGSLSSRRQPVVVEIAKRRRRSNSDPKGILND